MRPELGRLGVWTWAFDQQPWTKAAEAVAEMEELGYGTVWFGEGAGRDATTQAALLLSATKRIVVAPGIANIYRHYPETLAQAERALAEAFPGRFVLGLGVGGRRITEAHGRHWGPPLSTMRDYLDAMDAARLTAPGPAEPSPRVLAALGPKMLRLAAERTWGAHPFLLPAEHTAYAREIAGPGAVLAVHQAVAVHPDPVRAKEIARAGVSGWIAQAEVVPSRWNLVKELTGFDESDLDGGGSDRLVDAMVAAGDVAAVAERIRRQFDAGADHVCIGVMTGAPEAELALDELRQLAEALR
ncbi:TIGR03620 family F420-dependent LLM class oxidoreductase [Amycolatopsis minnesotensis]|uniref:TIGR03620 family F420-dependent LLM class oxidoreductase n=1 Tax=Amycolatopsis minnesotensis TaxID=337894 RepID=A0ABN2Q4H6_9PSEU